MRYITTPIYYASGSPHLGHAYTTLIADCYKRFYELLGEEVLLLTGTDEHGQKIERTAADMGIPVAEFIAEKSADFRQLWRDLDIRYDLFSRTVDPHHEKVVRQFWQRLEANGDIYPGEYKGLYCVDCEQYFTSGDSCPIHRKPLEEFTEESYFFRLGNYQNHLIEHIEAHPDFIIPEERRNEVLSFLKSQKLNDLSVSRTSTDWGVPVPGNPDHVMYVWVDALVTYLSGLGELSAETIEKWRHSHHFIGKDILIFHAVYWPALLMSAGLPVPRRLFVNGWLTIEGRKISKSDPSTIVDPAKLATFVGVDGLRYYLCQGIRTGQDLDFSHSRMISTLNSDLANNIGNLFSRVITLIDKQYAGRIEIKKPAYDDDALRLLAHRDRQRDLLRESMVRANLAKASRCVIEFASEINRYLQKVEPWRIDDDEVRRDCLKLVHHCLSDLTIFAAPFLPDLVSQAREGLCLEKAVSWDDLGNWSDCISVRPIKPIYKRLNMVDL